jgi:hypothetical protein
MNKKQVKTYLVGVQKPGDVLFTYYHICKAYDKEQAIKETQEVFGYDVDVESVWCEAE